MRRLALTTTVAVATTLVSIPTAPADGRFSLLKWESQVVAHGPKRDAVAYKQGSMGNGSLGSLAE
jgi:hypothetical protein